MHTLGGTVALVGALIVGARRERGGTYFHRLSAPAGHNLPVCFKINKKMLVEI